MVMQPSATARDHPPPMKLPPILSDAEAAPLFWRPSRLSPSAWFGHIPFAFWLVTQIRPAVLVELGTLWGTSYAAFCDAVLRGELPSRCFAVDTWVGDQHTGYYGEEVFADFRRFHDQQYQPFSTLLRMTFDAARDQFPDGAVDLLHIDGDHTYDAVRHDFEAWRPKLSERAVVLFHDTNVRERDFGVWRLWQELRQQHPGFEFFHSSGLGVLATGAAVPASLSALFEADDVVAAAIRNRLAVLGAAIEADAQARQAGDELARLREETTRVNQELIRRDAEFTRERAELLEQLRVARVEAGRERRDLGARLSRAQTDLKAVAQDRDALTAARSQAEAAVATLKEQQRVILQSTSWRLTAPLRRVGRVIPAPIRRFARGAVGAASGLRRSLHGPPPLARPAEAAELRSRGSAPRVVYVSGEAHTPGHQYRVVRYVEAAEAAGAKAWWLRVEDLAPRIDEVAGTDVVVIWRTRHIPEIERLIGAARARGARIVFDIDDLMFRPELATLDFIDGIRSQGFRPEDVAVHYENVGRVLAVADVCTCTTTELAQQIRRFQKATYVLPNGFDEAFHRASRLAVRRRRSGVRDGLVRIGYASGSRTHQRDFAEAAGAIARVLAERPGCRLVLFRASNGLSPLLDLEEFPAFDALSGQIEWREMVPLQALPDELARFDINVVPLELGNPFCEAKSELKYFEAALVEMCTVASPTGPMRRAIRDGETGLLAGSEEEWYRALTRLVDEPTLREGMGHAAYLDVLWPYSGGRRAELVRAFLAQMTGGAEAARAFELELRRGGAGGRGVRLPRSEAVFVADRLGQADATVVIPLYNYEQYVAEALESVLAQTVAALDLVVVDDASTDRSLEVAAEWARERAARFNRVAVLRNRANAGLALTRNAGFDAAETPYVLPLDADNRLLPRCVEVCLGVVRQSGAAFAYPAIRWFGGAEKVIDAAPFEPMRLAGGNYIDAMALVSKSAWAAVGGYEHIEHGWEDYDFWCRCAERGFWGAPAREVLAEYRVHEASMLHRSTDVETNKPAVIRELEQRHSWLSIPAPE